MKLLIILLCLGSERYLIHTAAKYRSRLFFAYFNGIGKKLLQTGLTRNPYLLLTMLLLPVLLLVWALLALGGHLFYGFIGLIINFLVFYFSMSPDNPFYPVRDSKNEFEKEGAAKSYLIQANSQLFALIFWFVVLGPLGLLFYRLLYESAAHEATRPAAERIIAGLDWVSVRVTVLLYLLAGNFQPGFQYYSGMFFSSPANNSPMLGNGGLLAARLKDDTEVTLPAAQILVEQALIIFLVFLALFTIVAWL